MTKEPIIIDGVDVAECFYWSRYANTTVYHCDWGGECKEYPNCYYKKLKKKEQECEKLKDLADHNGRVCNERLDKIDELEHNINELNGQLDQLKAENEKEKALKQTYLSCYKTKHGDVKGKLFKYEEYKQALQEIKNLTENACCKDLESCKICVLRNSCTNQKILQILQKYEVIDANI